MTSISPLAVLHASAPPTAGVVLGGGCPPALAPAAAGDGDAVELVVVAPDARQARDDRWLPEACAHAVDRLSDSGIVVAWGGGSVRRRLAAAGARAQLVPDVTALAARRGGSLVVPHNELLRRVGEGMSGALVLRPSGAGPALAWLDEPAHRGCTIRCSPRTGSVIVDTASGVHAKVAADAAVECEQLGVLGPGARAAGAAVPAPRLLTLDGVDVLVHPRLPGRNAARLLAWRRASPSDVLRRLALWLEAWGQATHQVVRFGATSAYAELLADAELLAPLVGDEPVRRLRRDCDALADHEVGVVAAHRDLTMWNVLLSGEVLGVVDWQASTTEALPLVDLVYAAVDAVAAARRYRASRVALLKAADELISPLRERLARALDLRLELAALSARACWVHHAANELRRPYGTTRPFLELARISLGS